MTSDDAADSGWVDAEAAAIFGPALSLAQAYAQLLTGAGTDRGIVGPGEASRIWERHLLNCAVVSRMIPVRCSVADIGSGAGLPGLVLAMLRPESHVLLIESMARRAQFLRECVAELGVSNAEVIRGRAEELAGKVSADVVTSRAVAPLGKLAGLSVPLARAGGRVIAMKGASAAAELAQGRPALARLGIADARVEVVRSASGAVSATIVTFTVPEHQLGQRAATATARPGQRSAMTGQRRGDVSGGRFSRASSRRGGA